MKSETAIFSWFKEQLHNTEDTFQLMNRYQIGRIYQYCAPDDFNETIKVFLKTAKTYKKEVYFLAGEPEWALETNRQQIVRYIEGVMPYLPLIKGVVLDIEPHTLDAFKANPKKVMQSFTENLKYAYSFAKKHELDVIVCLPYYYDNLGYQAELAEIIGHAADEVAIMNYYRGKEIEHIQFEVESSGKFQKSIQTIYELQPPGKHGLTDQNTYYNKGLKAVYQNYEELKVAYPKQHITLSFHEFQFFKELSNKE